MGDAARAFYDDLADYYHLIFQDWDQSIQRQAGVLGPLMEGQYPAGPLRILDCAAGIGTQTLGLAGRGHALMGTDLSEAAIARARREAQQRNLAIPFEVADMRDLSGVRESGFDVVLAADNALPHLLTGEDLCRAVQQIGGKLRRGGLFIASIRDYDQAIANRPITPPPAFFQDDEYRRIVHQIWDWTSDRLYTMHLYITQETRNGWTCRHFTSVYRALLREELTSILTRAGFGEVRWLMPAESGYYQPLVLARHING
jgi:glycine/sarcosine N-methyltransferase